MSHSSTARVVKVEPGPQRSSGARATAGADRDADSDAAMLSVVIPVYNEADNVEKTYRSFAGALDGRRSDYEVIFVDDGSTDGTRERLRRLAHEDKRVRLIELARNFGQTAATMAGLDSASGSIIVIMDGDGQLDGADIPEVVHKLNEGYDVVSGWRYKRQDKTLTRKIPSWLANRLMSWVTGVRLHDYGCSLKAYRSWVIREVHLYGEMHRFIPVYAAAAGARITEVPVNHFPRTAGKSKYGLERVFKVLLDLAVVVFLHRFLTKPIYVFGGFGFFCLAASLLTGLLAVCLRLFAGISFILTPLPLATVTLFLVGFISILLGLVAELQSRTYFESQGKRPYVVQNRINFDADD
jgi:glycosyltransferase involved in cell wall biosynthesis